MCATCQKLTKRIGFPIARLLLALRGVAIPCIAAQARVPVQAFSPFNRIVRTPKSAWLTPFVKGSPKTFGHCNSNSERAIFWVLVQV